MQRHDIENTVRVHFLSGLADHAQACYGGGVSKSMKAMELAIFREGCRRKIAISLTTPESARHWAAAANSWA